MRKILVIILILSGFFVKAQLAEIAILDLSAKNNESTKGNVFSIEHILKTGGFIYDLTDSVNNAIRHKIVFFSSNIEANTFSQAERDSITSFVTNGGVVIATNIKDSLLYNVFQITGSSFHSSRFFIKFKTDYDPNGIFKFFDEPEEKTILLGDSAKYSACIGSRAHYLISGDTLASYETGEVAVSHSYFAGGQTYLLGVQYKEVVLRPQVKKDYTANRAYSNGFEPGQDVFTFLISGIIKKHLNYVVYKHTAPCNFKAALILTHDVDATTAMERFDDYASHEKENNISSTYLITTHYVHDKLARNFYDGYEEDIKKVSSLGHDIQSHSVSHMPDFDNLSRVAIGSPGNDRYNYYPYYDGSSSSNVTVFGEAEVSKKLLEDICDQKITAFRPGYLAFHDSLMNVLDALDYKFSSSLSANNVMSNFPFFGHKNYNMSGTLTNVLEIPNNLSDVFSSDPINQTNYNAKVDQWESAFLKAYHNYASSPLLVHPTRYYKLFAQQSLINKLPSDAVICNLEEFGNYWLCRDDIRVESTYSNDTIRITLNTSVDSLNELLSFIVQNGKDFNHFIIKDKYGLDVGMYRSSWENNDVILYFGCERPDYSKFQIKENPEAPQLILSPNPSLNGQVNINFNLMEESQLSFKIFDLTGKLLYSSIQKKINLGSHTISVDQPELSSGVYLINVVLGEYSVNLKWVNRSN